MRIVYFGSADFGIPCLDRLKSSKHELVGIFTQPAHKAGRGRKEKPTDVALWAASNGVACTEAGNINSEEMINKVADCKADLIVVIAFGQYIGKKVIALHSKGAINVHGSLLPKWRGAAPVNAAVVNGDTEAGISIITVAERMDAGFVLGMASCPVTEDDTAGTLYYKLAELSPDTLLKAIDQIEDGTAVYTEQDESKVTLAPKMNKQDGYIDWSEEVSVIHNKIRGYWPWPGAQTDFLSAKTQKKCRVTITKARIAETDSEGENCGVLDENLKVVCGKGKLEIVELKPAGKGVMAFKDFANGRELKADDMFVPVEKAGQNG